MWNFPSLARAELFLHAFGRRRTGAVPALSRGQFTCPLPMQGGEQFDTPARSAGLGFDTPATRGTRGIHRFGCANANWCRFRPCPIARAHSHRGAIVLGCGESCFPPASDASPGKTIMPHASFLAPWCSATGEGCRPNIIFWDPRGSRQQQPQRMVRPPHPSHGPSSRHFQ